MRFKNATPEEIEIDEAMDAHQDAMKFEHQVFRSTIVLYLVGWLLLIFGTGIVENVGLAIVMASILAFMVHFFLHIKSEKKRRHVQELVNPYFKKKSLPLLQDLREKFADDPTIRFIHNDDGSISVVRKEQDDERRSQSTTDN